MPRKELTRADIIEKIKKFKALAADTSASENERMQAMAHMRSLSDKHSISDNDIEQYDKSKEKSVARIHFGKPYKTHWLSLLCSVLAQFYKCFPLTLTENLSPEEHANKVNNKVRVDKHPPSYGVLISGDEIDVEIAEKTIEILLPQAIELSDALYSWAKQEFTTHIERERRNKKEFETWQAEQKSQGRVVYNWFTTSSTSSSTNFFVNWGGFRSISGRLIDLLKGHGDTMPEREDDLWVELENDWGMGITTSIVNRLELMRQEADREYNEQFMILSGVRYQNALIVRSQQLMAQKIEEARDVLMDMVKGRVTEIETEEPLRPKHDFMYEKGQGDGDKVKIEDQKFK